MKLMRLYTDSPLEIGWEIQLSEMHGHYLRSVLRLKQGSRITLFNGSGGEYLAEIICLSKQKNLCRILAFDDVDRELPLRIYIVQAACRNEKIETVLQKGTELGAAGFQIVACDRSNLRLAGEKLVSRLARWRRIVVEAAEQSGRTVIPDIHWRPHLGEIERPGSLFCLHPEADTPWKMAKEQFCRSKLVSFAIGPEGGWSEHDIDTLAKLGFQSISFGPRILRSETAAPALLAAVQSLMD